MVLETPYNPASFETLNFGNQMSSSLVPGTMVQYFLDGEWRTGELIAIVGKRPRSLPEKRKPYAIVEETICSGERIWQMLNPVRILCQ